MKVSTVLAIIVTVLAIAAFSVGAVFLVGPVVVPVVVGFNAIILLLGLVAFYSTRTSHQQASAVPVPLCEINTHSADCTIDMPDTEAHATCVGQVCQLPTTALAAAKQPAGIVTPITPWSCGMTDPISFADMKLIFPDYVQPASTDPTGWKTFEAIKGAMQFFTQQSFDRDGFVGGWVQAVYDQSSTPSKKGSSPPGIQLKITAPADVNNFVTQMSNFYANGISAAQYFSKNPPKNQPTWYFSLELGLPMTTFQCVQLLHFPPSETKQYADFLYAPTVARYDCLLRQNGMPVSNIRRQDRILDILPIVAPADDGNALDAEYLFKFQDYAVANLNCFLVNGVDSTATHTLPMMALGSSVWKWVWNFYGDQVKKQLNIQHETDLRANDVVTLQIVSTGQLTDVMFVNHPSDWFYAQFGKTPNPAESAKLMYEDQVGAGWNTLMAMAFPMRPDPKKVATMVAESWGKSDGSGARVQTAVAEQAAEFSYGSASHSWK